MGDIMAISGLALKVYTAYKDAPDDYRNIADEVNSLRIIIEEAARHFESTTLGDKKQQRGKEVLVGCQNVLKDLDALIEKYNALVSADRSQVFQRIKLGTEDIVTLRARLTSNTTLLNSFIQRLDIATITITIITIEYIILISRLSCDSHELAEMRAQLNTVLGLRRSSSLVSLAGSINTKKAYRNLCKGLFESGVTAEMIKSKEKEIHSIFKPPDATTTTSSQIDVSTNSETSPLPTVSTEPNRNQSRFAWTRPPVDFLVGPLMLNAASVGDTKRLKSTLEYVRNIDFSDNTRATALHHAASGGYNDIVQLLLSKGASIEARNNRRNTSLHLAASNGHTSTVELLLSKGASIEATSRYDSTPLHLAADGGHISTVELLISKGASIKATNYYKNTPLHRAALYGHTSTVELLLSKGASIEAMDEDNDTPLHLAAGGGHISTVELLLSKCASIEATSRYYDTPLHYAAQDGHTSTVELLLSKGASIKATNYHKNTPLHRAAEHGHTSTVELLLSKGASIEAMDEDNNTPLHLAADGGRISTVELLLSKGASTEATNKYNRTPAELSGNTRIVKPLKRAKVTNS